MILPLALAGWGLTVLLGIMILPIILGWLPTVFEFLVNFVLWLIWVLKYRNNK